MKPFELVIFDCDGVLVDSERIANQIFCTMLNEIGVAVTLADMFERFVGLSMPQCMEVVAAMRGEPPPAGFLEALRERTAAALKAEVTAMPGVEAVLAALPIPYCVASSGDHEKIRLSLRATGLLKYFDGRIFSVVDVRRPKPAPDVFLLAAERCGADPRACAVVEDTPTGVRAAVAAGMCAFGFAAHTPELRLQDAGARTVFDDMRALPGLLRNGVPTGGARSALDPEADA